MMAWIGAGVPGGEARMCGERRPSLWPAPSDCSTRRGLGFHKALPQVAVDADDGLTGASVEEFDGSEIFAADAIVALDDGLGGGTPSQVTLTEKTSAGLSVDKKSVAAWGLMKVRCRVRVEGVVHATQSVAICVTGVHGGRPGTA